MWGMFCVSVLVGLLFLYVPGFLCLRAFRLSRLISTVCAPLISIAAYNVLCIVLAKMGIFSSWFTIAGPVLLLSLIFLFAGHFIGRGRGDIIFETALSDKKSSDGYGSKFDWMCLGLYVVLGIVLATMFFVLTLDGPSSFTQEYDNIHHLGTIRSFADSGIWSPFGTSLYPSGEAARINPLPGAGFYPTAWSSFGALIVSALGAPIPLAANSVNFLLIAVVFPSNMFLLMRVIFRKTPGIIPFGSLCALGFAAFPWGLLIFGPLFPNMMAFAILPSIIFCFMSIFSEGVRWRARILAGALFCFGVVCLALTQPNAVFTAAVFLIPFCTYQATRIVDYLAIKDDRRVFAKVGFGLLFVVFAAVLWFALYKAPFMHSVVAHFWPSFSSKPQAILDVLLAAFRSPVPQLLLALFVVIGGVYTLYQRKYLWVTFSYVIICVLYFASAATDGPIRYLLTGFWYTDAARVAASAAIFAIPLASIGLWLVSKALKMILIKIPVRNSARAGAIMAPCIVAALFVCVNYWPGTTDPGEESTKAPFDIVAARLKAMNDTVYPHVYDAAEADFVKEVQSIVPAGSLIINEPNDGSAVAYGVDGLNVYYRYLRTYGDDDETVDSKMIRNRLHKITSDERVQSAVKNIGAEYLLVLDQGESPEYRPRLFTYEDGKDWVGIESVDDETPGFELVLKRGDMRLYKISEPNS